MADRGKSPSIDQTTPSARHQVILDVIPNIIICAHYIFEDQAIFYIFQLHTRDFVYETASQNSLQNEVSQLMRDSEIRESVDPLRVLQRTREKQNC